MSGNAFSLMEARRVVTQTKEIGAKFIVLCLSSSLSARCEVDNSLHFVFLESEKRHGCCFEFVDLEI